MKYTTNFDEVIKANARLVNLQTVDGEPFRFRGIVDHNGHQCAAVSDRYTLVQNRTLAEVLKDVLFDKGITSIDRGRCLYSNGRTRFDVHLPDTAFKVEGDPSNQMSTIQIGNDYGGGGSILVRMGVFRTICTNGMIAFTRGETMRVKHVGLLGYDQLYPLMMKALERQLAVAEKQREVAGLLASTAVPAQWVNNLLEETAKRYRSGLERALQRNTNELGNNSWAVTQAISEVATHEMRTGWAAETWATKAVQNLIDEINTPALVA